MCVCENNGYFCVMYEILKILILLSGIGHIGLSLVSPLIPKMLQWNEGLKDLKPLLRQMFWTYAVYILAINFCFGLVSVLGAEELLNQTFLAKAVCLFIGLYWLARVFVQFFYFDTTDAPKGLIFTLGEFALIGLFVGFTLVYLGAFAYNCKWI
ncbi:MAG: hypothetical protein EAZ95_02230 [Bacteroidetes bacterium]|nr:MAG: hypothetical protein EAZ95_02230 [Bacteroidota bacterium]